LKKGGKFHLRLNMCKRPIANKYREGKMKRTLKRESNICGFTRVLSSALPYLQ
ncbi:9077_t:CDS:2, partial [Acaulospora morrowiae]